MNKVLVFRNFMKWTEEDLLKILKLKSADTVLYSKDPTKKKKS